MSTHQTNPAYVTQPATVVAVTKDSMTLSTIGVSSCNQCSLRTGCGQRLITQASKCDKSRLTLPYQALRLPKTGLPEAHVATQQKDQPLASNHIALSTVASEPLLTIGQQVTLAIPQQTFIQASLWAFLVPMLGLFIFTASAQVFTQNQGIIALFGLLGLALGIMTMRWRLQNLQDTSAWQPYVLLSNEVTPKLST